MLLFAATLPSLHSTFILADKANDTDSLHFCSLLLNQLITAENVFNLFLEEYYL
jgi:hypothetical protein